MAPGSKFNIHREEVYSFWTEGKCWAFYRLFLGHRNEKGRERGLLLVNPFCFWPLLLTSALHHTCQVWPVPGASLGFLGAAGFLLCCCFLLNTMGCFISPRLFIKYLTVSFHLQEICETSHLPMIPFLPSFIMTLFLHYHFTGSWVEGKNLCAQLANLNV